MTVQLAIKKKAPEWARQMIVATASQQLETINALLYHRAGLTPLHAAATGAMLLATAAFDHYAPCDCDDRGGDAGPGHAKTLGIVRKQAHDMLDFYLEIQFFAQASVEGTA